MEQGNFVRGRFCCRRIFGGTVREFNRKEDGQGIDGSTPVWYSFGYKISETDKASMKRMEAKWQTGRRIPDILRSKTGPGTQGCAEHSDTATPRDCRILTNKVKAHRRFPW